VLTRAAFHFAKSRGVDADGLLRQAGLSAENIEDCAATIGVCLPGPWTNWVSNS